MIKCTTYMVRKKTYMCSMYTWRFAGKEHEVDNGLGCLRVSEPFGLYVHDPSVPK